MKAKAGDTIKCPQCGNETFTLVFETVDVEYEDGEEAREDMYALRCVDCSYSCSYMIAGAFANLEMERTYLQQELNNEKKMSKM